MNGRAYTLSMHRAIMRAPTGAVVDHINGDTLDNRRSNLRVVTQAQNSRNRRKTPGLTSAYKGVYYRAEAKSYPWCAIIQVNGMKVQLGQFMTERDAALAYNAAATRLHGEFARLNDLETD
jgi:HNH endonuclease/AP2 domain